MGRNCLGELIDNRLPHCRMLVLYKQTATAILIAQLAVGTLPGKSVVLGRTQVPRSRSGRRHDSEYGESGQAHTRAACCALGAPFTTYKVRVEDSPVASWRKWSATGAFRELRIGRQCQHLVVGRRLSALHRRSRPSWEIVCYSPWRLFSKNKHLYPGEPPFLAFRL